MWLYVDSSCIQSCNCGDSNLRIAKTSEYEKQMLVCEILPFQRAEQDKIHLFSAYVYSIGWWALFDVLFSCLITWLSKIPTLHLFIAKSLWILQT